MAGEQTLETLIIELRADVAQLKSGLDTAKKETQKAATGLNDAVKEMGKNLAAALSVKAAWDFAAASVKAFAEVERAMNRLAATVKRTGGDWAGMEERVRAYVDQAEAATRFQDNEVSDSLSNLTLKVGDLNTAMKLNEYAMDLAVATGMDLASASQTIALAYQGNERGVMMLAKSLGVVGEKAKDTEYLFGLMDQKMQGMARSEEGAAMSLNSLSDAVGNFMEYAGEAFAPAAEWLAEMANVLLPWLGKAIKSVATGLASVFFLLWKELTRAGEGIAAVGRLLRDVWTNPRQASKAFKAEFDRLTDALVDDIDTAAREIEDIWADTEKKKVEVSRKGVKEQAKLNRDRVKAEKDAAKERERIEREAAEFGKKAYEELKEKAKEIAGVIAEVSQQTATQMVEAYRAGTLSIGKFFEMLGKAIFKMLVKAIGQALIQEAASYIARGIAALMGIYTASLAPGMFMAGASLAAAGGAIIGVAEAALAEGGIVKEPTVALIGEAGPEKVVPLGKDDTSGGINVAGGIHVSLPEVKNPSDFSNPRVAEAGALRLLEATERMNRRRGLRAQRG